MKCPHGYGQYASTYCGKCFPPVTKVQVREDLLMLTGGQYPEAFCPRTNAEEIHGVLVARKLGGSTGGWARILIGRGFTPARHGHKAYLLRRRKNVSPEGKVTWRTDYLMDTSYVERQSMRGAVAWCPRNARVFVGGLGLGLILLNLAKSGRSREVVVGEIDPTIIGLMSPILRRWFNAHYPDFRWRVVRGDALETVRLGEPYDWIYMDIWSNSNTTANRPDGTYGNLAEPMIDAARDAAESNLAPGGRITCWMERTIRGTDRKSVRIRNLIEKSEKEAVHAV